MTPFLNSKGLLVLYKLGKIIHVDSLFRLPTLFPFFRPSQSSSVLTTTPSFLIMVRAKSTIRKMSPPPKRAKFVGGVTFASLSSSPPPPSSSSRPVVGLLSHRPTPDEAMHHALTPLLEQGIMQRMYNLGLDP
ncbi:hypothetical protein LIER_32058 [Lithospermum erythrorhizon]|uniref:Uncharacterized protein n=1 Tax=Lithospermum erythrorhizon TaxID=34254 RepID=A0AAV3RVY3_LITER